jgi:hypothetical protein
MRGRNHPPLPLAAIDLPETLRGGYEYTQEAQGLPIHETHSLKNIPYWILGEWEREINVSQSGFDKQVEPIQDEYSHITSCIGFHVQLDKMNSSWDSDEEFTIYTRTNEDLLQLKYIKPSTEKKLQYIPDVEFDIYLTWYHRIDGWIYDKSFSRQLNTNVEYNPNSVLNNEYESHIEAVREGLNAVIERAQFEKQQLSA